MKNDEKWRRDYMTLYMRDIENRQIGKEIGQLANTISLIRSKKNKYDEDTLSDLYEVSKQKCQKILSYINNEPDLNDEEIAEKLLDDEE